MFCSLSPLFGIRQGLFKDGQSFVSLLEVLQCADGAEYGLKAEAPEPGRSTCRTTIYRHRFYGGSSSHAARIEVRVLGGRGQANCCKRSTERSSACGSSALKTVSA